MLMFDTTVILKNVPRTAVQQLQNCSTNKRQTKWKHLRLCIQNLSATYEWPRAKPSCCSKYFIHRCLHKWFGHPQQLCSSADLIPVAGLGALRCGLSSRAMWPKSSVEPRTYKNCHMPPKRSCLMFYFSIYQMGINLEVPSKTGCVFTWAAVLHWSQASPLAASWYTHEKYISRFSSVISLHPHEDLFPPFCSFKHRFNLPGLFISEWKVFRIIALLLQD